MENSNENNTHTILHSTDESNVVKRKFKFRKLTKNVSSINSENPGQGVRKLQRKIQQVIYNSFSPTVLPDNMKVRKRFAQTSEEDIFTIKEKRFEEKTVKSTIWGVKIFKDWLQENDLNTDFEALLP